LPWAAGAGGTAIHFMTLPDLRIDPPYSEEFKDLLAFSSFAETEKTLFRLDYLCRKYQLASDKKGVEYCRQIAVLGRRRAELISRNRRVNAQKRLQKNEIAQWFTIWLETPSIFENWLSMRKDTEEFGKLLESETQSKQRAGDPYASRDKSS
jgi:hypothetical protein